MKCKVFIGPWNQVMDSFNIWAKGKALSRNVIVHTQAYIVYRADGDRIHELCITVYHPEGEPWEGVES